LIIPLSAMVMVLRASFLNLPQYLIEGYMVLEDIEYPKAIFPEVSIAALAIHRNLVSGA
jgi:hypothetical protein